MGEDMTTYLQQTLRGLCYKTQWKYTIFWKLKYQARLMLTWEDAYYDRSDSSDPPERVVGSMCPTMTIQNFNECQYKRDPLELALVKMSSLVYSLGEGLFLRCFMNRVIGRVAFTGKHQWIFADKPEMKSLSSSELSDDLQSQFSAGIKTIAVVAVMPLGVVLLGSLSSMGEDLKLVTRIKDLFGLFCSSAFLPDLTKITNNITNLPGTMMKSPGLEASNDSSNSLGQAAHRKSANIFPYAWSLLGKYNSSSQTALLLPSVNQRKLFNVSDDHAGAENTEPGTHDNTSPLQFRPGNICLEFQKQVQLKQKSVEKIRAEAKWGRMCMGCSSSNDVVVQAAAVSTKSDRVDSQQTDGHGLCERLEMKIKPELEKQSDQTNSERNIGMENLLNFSTGCELQEALGPPFKKKQDFHVWEDGATQRETISHINDESLNSLFTPDDGSNHLLEAVVASACINSGSISSESSLCKSTNISITDSMLQSPEKLFLLRSGSELIQRSSSVCSGLLERQTEQTKLNRKKAKSGESGRPRPRDRQLIQDRIKELRQIVPNGSKCSIDALLEHTVKHMLFLQSVTRHAEKLKRYLESKLFDKSSYFLGNCNSERGASWVVEVGGQSKASPIIIENMDMHGQMLIEMLCEECNLFLEIAEVIRGMGLTILRGVIETRDGKTWACFVVEGQGKNQLQRMDIMWSLMRFFQPQP